MDKKRGQRIICLLLLAAMLCAGCKEKPEGTSVVSFLSADTPAPAAAPTPTPTPKVDALNVSGGVYTIAWLSDTQHYSENHPDTFFAMTRFLSDPVEQRRMNLKYAIFTGDFVDIPVAAEQWDTASAAMSALDDTLPYGVLGGNHDYDAEGGIGWSYYCLHFGESRFSGKPWYGGSLRDNRGHYDLLDIGDTPYLFLYISYRVHDASVEWLNEVLSEYPDRVCILMTHEYFDENGEYFSDGKRILEEVLPRHDNVYMVLCGHRYASAVVPLTVSGPGGERTVLQCMTNYQAAGSEGGSGYMRFIQVNEAEGTMRMINYSPVLDDFIFYDGPGDPSENHGFDPSGEDVTVDIPWR